MTHRVRSTRTIPSKERSSNHLPNTVNEDSERRLMSSHKMCMAISEMHHTNLPNTVNGDRGDC
jgi:hypothetical protein